MPFTKAVPILCALTLATVTAAGAAGQRDQQTGGQSQQELGQRIVGETQENIGDSQATSDAQGRVSEQMSSGSNAMGVPEPGTVGDQESTKKQRQPSRAHSAREDARVTLGGSRSFVEGEVSRIDGNNYFVKDQESGDEVRLLINQDTNLVCGAAASGNASMKTDRQPIPTSGMRENETAAGSGFKTGDCSFNDGDRVKAEVSDIGTVTTLELIPKDQSSFGGTVKSPDAR